MTHSILLQTLSGLKDLRNIKTIRETYRSTHTLTSGYITIPLGLLEGGVIAAKSNNDDPAPDISIATPTQLTVSSANNASMGLTTSNNWELLIYRSS